jgi:hypothetical protein
MFYQIIVFDDGNQEYEKYENKWNLIENLLHGKVKLQNVNDNTIYINSISWWKVIKYKL